MGAVPDRKQRESIRMHGLDPYRYSVIHALPEGIVIRHNQNGSVMLLRKKEHV